MANRPNILFLMTDQQSGDAMSCVGNQHLATPAADSLAERGVVFSRAYCTQPVCSPSRASMFTGLTPHQAGVHKNNLPIAERLRTAELGNVFGAAGYDCVYGGKWHVPEIAIPDDGAHGFRRICGFDDAHLAQRCIAYLEEPRDKPFLMVASFDNPHNICEWTRSQPLPWGNVPDVPAEDCPPLPANFAIPPFEPQVIRLVQDRNPRAFGGNLLSPERWRHYRHAYNRLVEKVDAQIGRILDALRALGLEDDTLIVLTSDHGDGQGAHRWNQKVLFYEEQVRVPFIVSWKGVTRAGHVDDHLISNGLDLYPTLCDYAGLAPPDDLPGSSLRPLLEGHEPDAWRSYVASEMPLQPSDGWNVQSLMIRTERHKYTAYSSGHYPEQLFDLEEDPGEMINMAVESRHADLLQQHRELAYAWCQETGYRFGTHSSHRDVPFLLPGYQFE